MFDYVRADSAEQAASLLQRHGEGARILAGGQSLMAVLNMRLAQPLYDRHLAQHRAGRHRGEARFGARGCGGHQAQLQAHPEVPPLALAFPFISTFGSAIAARCAAPSRTPDPSAELPAVPGGFRASVHLRSARGARQVPAHDFFTGLLSTGASRRRADRSRELSAPGPGESFGFAEHSAAMATLRCARWPPW